MSKQRANISVNASTLAVAKYTVEREMARRRASGRVVGGAAADKRPDDKVAIYTQEPNRRTWIVYVER